MAKTYSEQLRNIVDDYIRDGHKGPISTMRVAAWAVETGRFEPRPGDIIKRCARDISETLRHEHFTDEQGRSIRAKHAAKTPHQGTLWDDIRTAPRAHMNLAFAQRRNQVVSDCYQLKQDVDYYNDSRPEERPYQLKLDFYKDVAMKEMEFEELVLN